MGSKGDVFFGSIQTSSALRMFKDGKSPPKVPYIFVLFDSPQMRNLMIPVGFRRGLMVFVRKISLGTCVILKHHRVGMLNTIWQPKIRQIMVFNNQVSGIVERKTQQLKGKPNNHLETFSYSIYSWALDLSNLPCTPEIKKAHNYQVASCFQEKDYLPIPIFQVRSVSRFLWIHISLSFGLLVKSGDWFLQDKMTTPQWCGFSRITEPGS